MPSGDSEMTKTKAVGRTSAGSPVRTAMQRRRASDVYSAAVIGVGRDVAVELGKRCHSWLLGASHQANTLLLQTAPSHPVAQQSQLWSRLLLSEPGGGICSYN
jgi:hypothetical protein